MGYAVVLLQDTDFHSFTFSGHYHRHDTKELLQLIVIVEIPTSHLNKELTRAFN
jgi:hypothetical protein